MCANSWLFEKFGIGSSDEGLKGMGDRDPDEIEKEVPQLVNIFHSSHYLNFYHNLIILFTITFINYHSIYHNFHHYANHLGQSPNHLGLHLEGDISVYGNGMMGPL